MRSSRSQDREDDWTNMAMSDWMDMTPADWMKRTMAWLDRSYSDYMSARPSEWLSTMYSPFRPGMGVRESPVRDIEYRPRHEYRREWGEDYEHRKKYHRHECGRCGRDECECYCCIGDVDLAVYTRVGEQRVIQIVLENERHRDKEVTLELSNWTTRGGKAAPVETVLLEPKTFTIPACGEQNVTLVVKMGGAVQTGANPQKGEKLPGTSDQPGTPDQPGTERRFPDVDDCITATADLRLVGCDNRPIRIAVAILPRDCDPYRVSCGCTCC